MSTVSTGAAAESTLEQLQNMILDTGDVEDFLDEFVHFAAAKLSGPDVVLCGVTLLRHNKAATVASSSERAQDIDELQYEYGDGPCLHAAREHETVYLPSLADDERWPEYTRELSTRGVHSVLAVPFYLEGEARAALNLYSHETAKFDGLVETAEDFAVQASNALRLALRLAQHSDTESNLRAAMASRTTIDLAVGIIMGQSRCTQEEGFDILRRASSHRNIKVRDVAAEIVATVGQDQEPTTHFKD